MKRKTRFVCVSDTHGYTPSEAGFRLPAGDVLIHAGDLTNQGSESELRKTINWIAQADFEAKIVVAGNHDVTLDPPFYAAHGSGFQYQRPQDPRECLQIVTKTNPSVVYLNHQAVVVRLTRESGPRTIFKVFGSPFSPSSGTWAFGYQDSQARELWRQIPHDTDVLVTHTPPHSHCDSVAAGQPLGCAALRDALETVRPVLAVCGHVHGGRGYERVVWSEIPGRNSDIQVTRGQLPPVGSKKQNLVDLTGKRAPRIENEGCAGRIDMLDFETQSETHRLDTVRRETCIVNASIKATNHQKRIKFNPPIVVDIDLPVDSLTESSRQ
ncbi:hypothetical protein ASPZODRAFT_63438 [Penicilliopsis zonata CBS 506.65]|uniref:Calcineurin-like phosphoesterase domain-containing protein n=1 Tax=Penicilliopsis zonata CBS 506.65 TaxID=1073090 RepID=A0A1L9SKH5_9EURO|nr:hypothetical protein ASPZODRAFT_63438 [Penicilliopsis zonata CBS 506.65]OJJ47601.1 hypothetical protein ASPZODRAFT_63438 [Penicilliopsis zonata CBS 506.65]